MCFAALGARCVFVACLTKFLGVSHGNGNNSAVLFLKRAQYRAQIGDIMATRSTKTTKAKTTAAKPAKAAPKTATKTKIAKATATTPAPKATVVGAAKPVVAGAPIKKPELIERVMAETGMKKKDVRPVVEAMLTVLGRALSDGEELVAPPLGKVMVKRVKELPNARVMNVKIRHPLNAGGNVAPASVVEAAE